MYPNVTLRPATLEDRAALKALKHQMNLSAHHWKVIAGDPGAEDDDLTLEAVNGPIERDYAFLAEGKGGIILAFIGTNPVGYVSFTVKEGTTSFRAGARAFLYVSGLAVDETHRNFGIGALLLSAVDTEARIRSLNKVMLDVSSVSPAVNLYQRAGFTPVAHAMMKRLS